MGFTDDVSSFDVPSADTVGRLVTRGRAARFLLAPRLSWRQTVTAARTLQAELARDDLLVIAVPGHQRPSLTVLQLISSDDAEHLRTRLAALVKEFRESARRLVAAYRLLVEPAYERGSAYPDSIDVGGERWLLDIHGEHCRFQNDSSDAVVEAHLGSPDLLDPGFLLLFARSSGRYSDIHAACVAGFHDMDRMLALADIPLGVVRG